MSIRTCCGTPSDERSFSPHARDCVYYGPPTPPTGGPFRLRPPFTARCGSSDEHGAHVIDRGEDGSIHGWCAGNVGVVQALTPEDDAYWTRYRNGEGE